MSDISTAIHTPRPAQAEQVKMTCPFCQVKVDPIVKTVHETEEYAGMSVFTGYSYNIAVCPVCGSRISILQLFE